LGVALGSWACGPTKETPDAGPADVDSGPSDDSGPGDAGHDAGHDAGPRDSGFDAGDAGPDSGCLPDASCGITTPPNAGDPGWFCTLDSQCGQVDGGFCQMQFHRCSRPCGTIADCPVSWQCAPLTTGGENVCQCPVGTTVPPAPDTCNNVDDNCDGLVDNGSDLCAIAQVCSHGSCECPAENTCGSFCTDLQTDVSNCGVCGHECSDGYVCVNGGCNCPTTANNVICQVSVDGGTSFVCSDSSSDPLHCGACENHCSQADDCVAGECHTSDREWARWSLKATPAYSSGSVVGTNEMIATVNDSVTGLAWQASVNGSSYSWASAATYCASLGTGWRVPSRIEALSIVDFTKFAPALDATVFTQSTSQWGGTVFWTASAKGSNSAWSVDFRSGYSNAAPQTNAYAVRCVQ
jgi:hypothetical protein